MRKYCSQVVLENFFEPYVLFLLLEKPSYGYELNRKLKKDCHCQVNIGNLYRGLNRMVTNNLVVKKKSKSDIGPTKIIYTITESGQKHLSVWIDNLKKEKNAINKLIKSYESYYETNK